MGRKFSHLSHNDRLVIARLRNLDYSVREIAEIIGVNDSTIYRELKRSTYIHLNSDYTEESRYNPDGAEERYRKMLKMKGPDLKIGNDLKYAQYLENKIRNESYSPAAALASAKISEENFQTSICLRTLYGYVKKGILNLSEKDLPQKGRIRKKRGYEIKKPLRASIGTSIEKRPEVIKNREEFGHWEMDTVKGKQGESKNNLLVLTERSTRGELIRKMDDGKAISVIKELDKLEQELGERFYKIFKSITVDNGVEFSNPEGMENSLFREEKRTKVYFCHPYSSYERGSNENANRLIRRWIPKGYNFDSVPEENIRFIQGWINNYPRRLFKYHTAGTLFLNELQTLRIDEDVGIKLLGLDSSRSKSA